VTGEDGEVLDLDGIEVVPGFEGRQNAQARNVTADEVAHLKGLANGFPTAARVVLKDLLAKGGCPTVFDETMPVTMFGKVGAIIRGVERDVERGKYADDAQGGDDAGDDDGIEDATIVDDDGNPLDAVELGRLEADPDDWQAYSDAPFTDEVP
jgi:hypothetical protein